MKMAFEVEIPKLVSIFAILACMFFSPATTFNPKFRHSLESFNQHLFTQLIQSHGRRNIIYSPFSIQTSLAMTRMGANGKTADELDYGLSIIGQSPARVAESYYSMLTEYENSDILKVANKIYVKKNYTLQSGYKELLAKKFFSSVENLNFTQKVKAAETINTWIAAKTKNGINNIISPVLLGDDIRMILFSVMYFNGKWATAFPKENTSEQDFYIDEIHTQKIQMMFRKGAFDYGLARQLIANVVRLPCKNSDLSLLIILPIRRAGLTELVNKLETFKFQSLRNGILKSRSGLVHLPKFKVEFEIELSDALKKMGMKRMFENGEFGNMLNSSESVYVSKVVHKASIEITEGGLEASTNTGEIGRSRLTPFTLKVNHPFVYAIVNEAFIPLFQGTFVGF